MDIFQAQYLASRLGPDDGTEMNAGRDKDFAENFEYMSVLVAVVQ